MPEWRATTLSQLVKLQRGHDLPTDQRRAGSVPVVGAAGPSGTHDTALVTAPGVVVGRAGGSMGKATYCDVDFWPLNTSLYVTDFLGNDPRFAYYLLTTIDFSGFNSGAAQPMLNRNYITNIPIVLPEPAEQRSIAAVLGALEDKIAVNERIAAKVDDLCAALFQEAVERGGAIEVELGKVASVNAASVKPRREGRLRYIDIASVGVGTVQWPELSAWSTAPGRARRSVSSGDTIWSTVRPNRRSHALILESAPELVASTGLAVLTPMHVGVAYLYECTRREPFVRYLESVAEGSTYPAVRAEKFGEAMIPLLPHQERDVFERRAFPLRQGVASAAKESRTLVALRDTLLPKLMSGQITMRQAEKTIEETL